MKFGSHVSIRHGYLGAAQQAWKMGATSFQYFPKNPRSLTVKSFDEQEAVSCATFCKEYGITSIAHAPYPVNLSADDKEIREIMLQSLRNDLDITDRCGSLGLVVHFGKFKGTDPLEGYKLMIQMLNQLLYDWQGQTLVLIENNAGQGVKMGITFEELVQVRNLCDYPEKIGFCFDTCHAFASGLWAADWQQVQEKGTQLGYFEHLKAVHLNDSVYPFESFRDRHASVGKGHIGEQRMKEFMLSEVICGLPLVLETPEENHYTHKEEIEYLKQLVGEMSA
jgi:deoxyribonuclease IV